MSKDIIFGQDARFQMFAGIEKLARAVSATMGPNGRTWVVDKGRFNDPTVTKDGVSVAKEVQLPDPVEELGRRIAYEACDRTNRKAGDGTTCAAVLMHAMMEEGLKYTLTKRNVMHMRNGMDKACAAVVSALKELSMPIETQEQIAEVAAISSQDKVIGKIVADAMEKVGPDGTILTDIKQGSPGIEATYVEGMRIDRGFWAPIFITDSSRVEYIAEDAHILVTDERIVSQDQLAFVLDKLAAQQRQNNQGVNVVIIAPHFEGNALDFCIINKRGGKLNVCLVKAPYYGELMQEVLEDIAIYTKATFFSERYGSRLPRKQEDADASCFGHAKKIVVGKDTTTILGGDGVQERIDERVASLRAQADSEEDNFKKEMCKERISRMTGGVGIIKVAAVTDIATEELRYRIDDALCAARAAIQEGVVPGGGVALLRCLGPLGGLSVESDDEQVGVDIVKMAIQKPAWQIATVAGEKGDVIVNDILKAKGNYGYNIVTRKYVDMVKEGIIDPTLAISQALINAVSVAGTLLTMEGAIVDIPELEESVPNGRK